MPGSLSKEFPLADVEATMRLARPGMRYPDFRNRAISRTHRDIPGIVIQRFLLVRQGVIQRDRFLSLVDSERLGTRRMRKVMYGTWVLRDERVRRFILEVIADPSGRWRVGEVVRKSNADFFRRFLSASTVTKVRSNIEYFLTETGIYNPRNRTVNLELDDNWLSDAVAIAAEHQTNANVRRRMLADPMDFIIASGFNGIANATVAQLRGVPSAIQPDSGSLEDTEVNIPADPTRLNDHNWNRPPPRRGRQQAAVIQVNAVARERASQAHHQLERMLAERLRRARIQPRYNAVIDVFCRTASGTLLAEIKSCHSNNVHAQIRRGVAQLFEYAYVYRSLLTQPIASLLVLEMRPPSDREWLIPFLASIGVWAIWPTDNRDAFTTTMSLPTNLSAILL
jgi:hypothetical protein